ncbi:MAG: hypothetical protein Wins2KO_07510 [Winogradskyella sp.]
MNEVMKPIRLSKKMSINVVIMTIFRSKVVYKINRLDSIKMRPE